MLGAFFSHQHLRHSGLFLAWQGTRVIGLCLLRCPSFSIGAPSHAVLLCGPQLPLKRSPTWILHSSVPCILFFFLGLRLVMPGHKRPAAKPPASILRRGRFAGMPTPKPRVRDASSETEEVPSPPGGPPPPTGDSTLVRSKAGSVSSTPSSRTALALRRGMESLRARSTGGEPSTGTTPRPSSSCGGASDIPSGPPGFSTALTHPAAAMPGASFGLATAALGVPGSAGPSGPPPPRPAAVTLPFIYVDGFATVQLPFGVYAVPHPSTPTLPSATASFMGLEPPPALPKSMGVPPTTASPGSPTTPAVLEDEATDDQPG